MVLGVMNLPNNAEDLKNLGSIPGQEDALDGNPHPIQSHVERS